MSEINSEIPDKNISGLKSFVDAAISDIDNFFAEIDSLGRSGDVDFAGEVYSFFLNLAEQAHDYRLEVVQRLANSVAGLFDIIRRQNEAQMVETIAIIGVTFEFLREILKVAVAVHSDADFTDEADNIIIIIDHQTEAIKSMPGISESNSRVFNPGQTSSSMSGKVNPDEIIPNAEEETPNCQSSDDNDIEQDASETINYDSDIKDEIDVTEEQKYPKQEAQKTRAEDDNGFSLLIDALNDTSEIESQEIEELEKLEKDLIERSEVPIDERSAEPIDKQDELTGGMISEYLSTSEEMLDTIENDLLALDKIFDLVGELITIESLISNHPTVKSAEDAELSRSLNMLSKISRELQEVSMQVRMTALESLFNKMKRAVRDLSIKMNKQIDFTVTGAETEMDKNIIEEMADPLLHILQNAVGHGIELPEVRIAAGKPANGSIQLSADYLGNEILITVTDDGRGINKEKVLAKAIDNGIIIGDEPLSDKEIFALVFETGFSTSAEVTDISGRGAGMDVVKKNIEKLRGKVDIESNGGIGTKITLRIPLTLDVIDSMLVKVGGSTFAIPILSIKESKRAMKSQINLTMDGLEVMNLRGKILPVIRLNEFFSIESEFDDIEQGIIVICETHDKHFCLFVDYIVGQQQAVVKSLTKYIGNIGGITGCMILADGKVGLILDVESLAAQSTADSAKMGSSKQES